INDIVVETIGAIIGTVAWLVAGRRVSSWLRRLSSSSSITGFASRLLPGYLVALFIVQLMPFDFVLGRKELATKFTEGKVLLVPFHGPRNADALAKSILNLACFL